MNSCNLCIDCKYRDSELYEMPCIACMNNPGLTNLFQPYDKPNREIKQDIN